MKIELRKWLESNAQLNPNAAESDAWKAYHALEGDNRSQATAIRRGKPTKWEPGNPAPDEPDGNQNPQRTQPQDAQVAIAQERKRVSDIRAQFDGEFPELERTAIDEGWTTERTASELLTAIRKARTEPVGASPFIHSRGGDSTLNRDSLQAALLLRSGVALDSKVFQGQEAVGLGLPDWLRADVNSDVRQKAMNAAHQFSSMSMIDMCRASLQIAGKQVPWNQDELIRAAFDQGTLTPIFSTNVNARVLMGYMDAEDSTLLFTSDVDLADFNQADLVSMGKFGRLTRHARGKQADLMDVGAETEPIKLARYSGRWQLDEMDIINNRLGSGDMGAPEEMGNSAAQLRADLVYSILLANANLTKDATALFAAAENNDFLGGTSVMSVAGVEAMVTAMGDQRQRGRPLNLRMKYLIVAPTNEFEALRVTRSATVEATRATLRGTDNVLASKNIGVITESRVGTAGVIDPRDDTNRAGNNAQFFGAAAPGSAGAKTIAVGHRIGTNRAPTIRSDQMRNGEWGLTWDIKHDITAAPIDRYGLSRSGSDQ